MIFRKDITKKDGDINHHRKLWHRLLAGARKKSHRAATELQEKLTERPLAQTMMM